jgi:hypothetical protein
VEEGEDIVEAIKNLRGTSVANLEPNRKKSGKIKSLPGISNWFEWRWPVDSQNSGYIEAHSLPHFGKWELFSPAQIAKLSTSDFEQPSPFIGIHTVPRDTWKITRKAGMC